MLNLVALGMDVNEGHLHFSVDCFNKVWGLLGKAERTAEEDRTMREMAHASLFHWLQRPDVSPKSISIGFWQISRVYAVLADGVTALRYAEQCIEVSESGDLSPFYMGYGFEAAARAAALLKAEEGYERFVEIADSYADRVEDAESKAMLEEDLAELRKSR